MYHKILLIGNVGRQPEMRYTPTGTAVMDISVATSKKVNGEKVTTWWKVTVWRKLAETCALYIGKGSKVYVEGEIKGDIVNGSQNPRVWTGNDGNPRASYEMTGYVVRFLDSAGERTATEARDEAFDPTEDHDEIPF